jgi:hypothetical protein
MRQPSTKDTASSGCSKVPPRNNCSKSSHDPHPPRGKRFSCSPADPERRGEAAAQGRPRAIECRPGATCRNSTSATLRWQRRIPIEPDMNSLPCVRTSRAKLAVAAVTETLTHRETRPVMAGCAARRASLARNRAAHGKASKNLAQIQADAREARRWARVRHGSSWHDFHNRAWRAAPAAMRSSVSHLRASRASACIQFGFWRCSTWVWIRLLWYLSLHLRRRP